MRDHDLPPLVVPCRATVAGRVAPRTPVRAHRWLNAASAGACVVGAWLFAGCWCSPSSPPVGVPGGAERVADPTRTLAPFEESDPVASLLARVAPRAGACAQVRSLQDRAAAEEVAVRIREATRLPVEVLQADLGPRGIWFRLCVGDEENVARVVARGTRWTSPGGVLEPFLDPLATGEARFLVHERAVADPRRPTPLQARALLARTSAPGPLPRAGEPVAPAEPVPIADWVGPRAAAPQPGRSTANAARTLLPSGATPPGTTTGASALPGGIVADDSHDVWFAGTVDHPVVATTGPAVLADPPTNVLDDRPADAAAQGAAGQGPTSGATRIVVVDHEGRRLALDPAPAPGCASCAAAEQRSRIVARRVLGAGDVLPAPGVELLLEEQTADETRILVVVEVDGSLLRRRGAVLLAQSNAGIAFRGDAAVVEGDGDEGREIAVSRLELRFDGGNLCALTTRAEVWGPLPDPATGLARVDVAALAATNDGDSAVVDYITAVDSAGDRDAASRACARVLAAHPGTLLTQLCLQRVRALIVERRLVEAVNAASTLAEGTPALRAAVAGPLFEAMAALEKDARLSAAPWDCATSPLVPAAAGLPTSQVVFSARARLRERVGLADVVDAAFVTASRDFGPDTPVGQIAARWLERLRLAQPARHAAIEALLLPADGAPLAGSPPTGSPPAASSSPRLAPPASPSAPGNGAPSPGRAPGDGPAFGGKP